MNVKAEISFTGAVTMTRGELRELPDSSPTLKDLLDAGYVIGVDSSTGSDYTGMPTCSGADFVPAGCSAEIAGALVTPLNQKPPEQGAPPRLLAAEPPTRSKKARKAAEHEAERSDAGNSGAVCEN